MVAWWEAMALAEQVFASIGIIATVLLVVQVILLAIGMGGNSGADAGDAGMDAPDDIGDGGAPGMEMDTDVSGLEVDVDAATGDITIDVPDSGFEAHVHPAHHGDWYGPDGNFTAEGIAVEGGAGGLHLFTLQGLIAFFAIFGWSGLLMLKSGLHPAASAGLAVVFGFLAMALVAWLFKLMLRLQQDGSMDIKNALGKSGTVYMNIPPHRENKGKVTLMMQERLMELDAVTDEDDMIKTGMEVTVIGISNRSALIVRTK